MNMADQIALLHPGEMGVTIGACLLAGGVGVGWTSIERSEATHRRASAAGFKTYDTLEKLLTESAVVVSVCPPAAAVNTAKEVAATQFNGIYLDANAISPNTAIAISEVVEAAGASYVDGGIIGPPALRQGTTRLYLSGARVSNIIELFNYGALEAIDIGGSQTAASALKMCYAAWSKGSAALLLSVGALAKAANVTDALHDEWALSIPDLSSRLQRTAQRNAAKAWRFEGEMHEIAAMSKAHSLPHDFFSAAAETYALLSSYKGVDVPPELDEVLRTMLDSREN